MATEVTCPSPFTAAGSLDADTQIELIVTDSPTNVTWNPADKDSDVTLTGSDLIATNAAAGSVRGTKSVSGGKWYWEIRVNVATNVGIVGIGTSSANINSAPGQDAHSYGYHKNGRTYFNGSWSGIKTVIANDDVIGVALDLDNNKLWFLNKNSPINGGDPAAGTGEDYSGLSGTFFPMCGGGNTGKVTARFNSIGQTYSPPAGFNIIQLDPDLPPFTATSSLSISQIYPGYIDLDTAFSTASSLSGAVQPEILAGAFSAATSGQANVHVEFECSDPFVAVTSFSCDHCFNYAQISDSCPTPTCDIAAVFRYARIDADVPVPTASFRVGRIIEGDLPVPCITCTANIGRYPSLIANVPVPGCSMRVGLSLSDIATISQRAGVPVPTCLMVATSDHLATIFGNVPCPILTCTGDTVNITTVLGSAPCPRGLFEATIGNVADILGRAPCPSCSIVAITGQVVILGGNVPVPGSLVRFYASPMNVNITLNGVVPTPTMISSVHGLTSLILRHIRGEVR